MIRKIWDFGTAEFMANDYVYFFTFCQVLNILRGKRTGGIFICHSQALYRVRPIPIYRYQYIGIGMETLQTDTDSWRLIHTDTDISVWYRYIGMIPIYGYVTDSFWLFTDITLKYRYHTDIPTIYRYRYPPYPPKMCVTRFACQLLVSVWGIWGISVSVYRWYVGMIPIF